MAFCGPTPLLRGFPRHAFVTAPGTCVCPAAPLAPTMKASSSSATPGSDALSSRGRELLRPPLPYILRAISSRPDTYDPQSNPSGYIDLSIAENRISAPLVAEKLASTPPVPPDWLLYDIMHGSKRFRSAIASVFSQHLLHVPVQANEIAVVSGAGTVLDLLATAVCEPKDRVLITAPAYRMLEGDVRNRSGCEIVTASLDPRDGFAVTTAALEEAWLDAGGESSRIRMCIICSPNNPTGEVLSKQTILDIVKWARTRGVHLVMDEIYGMSVFDETKGDGFVSVAELVADLGDDVHIVWSMSKDFCISGARVGVLVTKNRALMGVMSKLSNLCSSSRHTQWALTHLLEDKEWVENYVAENNRRLKCAYESCTSALDRLGIPYRESRAGFFMCVDLRKWMKDDTEAAEDELWDTLCDEGKVLLTQGKQMLSKELGWFRICFAAAEEEAREAAWDRIEYVLTARGNIKVGKRM